MYQHLRDLREDRDMNQRDMAAMLHVGQTTYSDYERGNINIPIGILYQLADYYKTSIDYLLDRTDETKPYPPKQR